MIHTTQNPAGANDAPNDCGGGVHQRRSELRWLLWRFRKEFAASIFFSMIINVLMLSPTLYMLQLFDRVAQSRNEFTLLFITAVALYLVVMTSFAEWCRSRLLVRFSVKLDETVGSRVLAANFVAGLHGKIHDPAAALTDLTRVRMFLTGNGLFALLDLPWAPIYVAILYVLHPVLGIVSGAFVIMMLAVAYYGHRISHGTVAKTTETEHEESSFVRNKFHNADAIEAMGMLMNLRHRWREIHARYNQLSNDTHDRENRIHAVVKFMRYAVQALILADGAVLVIAGEIGPGVMIAANLLASRAVMPVDVIASTWSSLLPAWESFRRVETLLAEYPPRQTGIRQDQLRGEIVFRGVTTKSPDGSRFILRDMDLEFQPGEIVAIAGPSGSGKTTLARTVVGVWPVSSGAACIDGTAIDAWDRASLGKQMGYLPQQIDLFDGTVAENIARFSDIDSEQIVAAASLAGAHNMILRLPRGYDTPVGPSGAYLSAGQRQRIGLARALYGNPQIIVLDEPNANLDQEGEDALQEALRELKRQAKTVLVITHRPAVVGIVDRILVLQEGRIAQLGPVDDRLIRLPTPGVLSVDGSGAETGSVR